MPQACDVFDIEQRHCPARRLLEAAIGVAVERPQQAGNVPVGPRTDTKQSLPSAWQEFGCRTVVEGDALTRLQPPDETPELVGLRRPHPNREMARDLEIAGPRKLQFERGISRGRRRQGK